MAGLFAPRRTAATSLRDASEPAPWAQAKEFANSEQGEKVTDGVLDKAAAAASKPTGGKHDEQIDSARDTADKHVGTE